MKKLMLLSVVGLGLAGVCPGAVDGYLWSADSGATRGASKTATAAQTLRHFRPGMFLMVR